MSAIDEVRSRALLFLNANAGEIGEIIMQAAHARGVQKSVEGVRYDRRVLSELLLRELVAGTARRRELVAADADAFATQARDLAEALIKANAVEEFLNPSAAAAAAPAP